VCGRERGVASPLILHTSPERDEARRADQTTDRGAAPDTDRDVILDVGESGISYTYKSLEEAILI